MPTGMPTRSISLAIVAPQRLQVPQVATRSAPSTPRLLEILGDAAPELARHGHRRAHAGQRVDVLVHAADLPLALEVAQERQRQDVVRVAVDDVVEVAGVIGLPVLRRERLELGHRVPVIARGVGRDLPLGIALPHEAAGRDHGDASRARGRRWAAPASPAPARCTAPRSRRAGRGAWRAACRARAGSPGARGRARGARRWAM